MSLSFDDDGVDLRVANPVVAPVEAPAPSRPGGGHGLIGMRERAASVGGHLDAGVADHEFVLRARLPAAGDGA